MQPQADWKVRKVRVLLVIIFNENLSCWKYIFVSEEDIFKIVHSSGADLDAISLARTYFSKM